MRRLIVLPICACVLASSIEAHHGSANYLVDREIAVTGTVAAWKWANPHTRVLLTVARADGSSEEWDGEGPPLTWAAQRGWSSSTLQAGERVTLVMYPARQDGRGGLIKRIDRPGREALIVSRPWLDREAPRPKAAKSAS